MNLNERLNTISVSVIIGILLVYAFSFLDWTLSVIAFFSIIPLYFFVQKNYARYKFLNKIWHLDGAWRYGFPFALYLVIGNIVQIVFIGYDAYHLYIAYALRTIIVAFILLQFRSLYRELADFKLDGIAFCAGAVIFLLWIGLEGYYPMLFSADIHFDPSIFNANLMIILLIIRFIGSVFVASFIEELFTRSFLIRYAISPKWMDVPIGTYTFGSFAIVTLFFGLLHYRWLPGILTAIILNLLLYKKKNIFSCIQAHATANLFLFIYVVYTKTWYFW